MLNIRRVLLVVGMMMLSVPSPYGSRSSAFALSHLAFLRDIYSLIAVAGPPTIFLRRSVIYPLFAAPVLWTVATISLIFDPKPEYPPRAWATEERKKDIGALILHLPDGGGSPVIASIIASSFVTPR